MTTTEDQMGNALTAFFKAVKVIGKGKETKHVIMALGLTAGETWVLFHTDTVEQGVSGVSETVGSLAGAIPGVG